MHLYWNVQLEESFDFLLFALFDFSSKVGILEEKKKYVQSSSYELCGNRARRAGLANFNPLESHIILWDSPDGPTCAHIYRRGGGD
jgi:hypothetical protein